MTDLFFYVLKQVLNILNHFLHVSFFNRLNLHTIFPAFPKDDFKPRCEIGFSSLIKRFEHTDVKV